MNNAMGALLQSAVIFYARAFDPTSKHRNHINLESKLSEEQKAFHLSLIQLRHESLAHFGPAGSDSGDAWSEDIPAIIIDKGLWQVMVASKRSLLRKGFAEEFLDHLEIVAPLVSALTEKSKKRFEHDLAAAWDESDEIEQLLSSNLLDPGILGGWDGPFLGGNREGRAFRTLNDSHFLK